MYVTIISDCHDDNAKTRQTIRAGSLLSSPVTYCGVNSDIEAAGNLVDALDVSTGHANVILVNVAPRHGAAKKWPNGTPFGYFRIGGSLVVTTIDGHVLSLVKKLGLVDAISVFDIPTVAEYAFQAKLLSREQADYLKVTQFRSLEFMPRAAAWLVQGHDLPATAWPIIEVPDMPPSIWWVDNFGNCKTTLLPDEHDNILPGLREKLGHHDRLKDVANGETAVVTGSSGIGDIRFLEIMTQGGSASAMLNLSAADLIG